MRGVRANSPIVYNVIISPAASNYHRFYIADKSFVASDIAMLYQVGENGLNPSTLKKYFPMANKHTQSNKL